MSLLESGSVDYREEDIGGHVFYTTNYKKDEKPEFFYFLFYLGLSEPI